MRASKKCQCESCKRGRVTDKSISVKKKQGKVFKDIEMPFERDMELYEYHNRL